MKLKFLTMLVSIPSMAVNIPTKAIIPIEIMRQVIIVLVRLPRIEVKAIFMLSTIVTIYQTK